MFSRRRLKRAVEDPSLVREFISKRGLELIEPRLPIGINFFDREWDVLIILDACRYDLFKEFAPKHDIYPQFETVSSAYSNASTTKHWLRRTFEAVPSDILEGTYFVGSGSYPEEILDVDAFHEVEVMYRYATDPRTGISRPEAITDAAIDAMRTGDASKFVVHHKQPHAPFLHCIGKYELSDGGAGKTQDVWEGLRRGRFDKKEVWKDYGKNLLRGLDEVETLARNTDNDTRIVVTSDHGNALGEFGVYGHPGHMPLPSIRRVPWVELDGLGIHDYEVKGKDAIATVSKEATAEENLEALGYL